MSSCVEVAPAGHRSYRGAGEAFSAVFGTDPIVWVRVHDFQVVSLKATALRLLRALPYYKAHPSEISKGLKVSDELGKFAFASPTTLLVVAANGGARKVAHELKANATDGKENATIADAEELLLGGSKPPGKPVLILYLNASTFLDTGGVVAAMVKRALDLRLPIAPVQEQDPSLGGCPFRVFFEQCPKELQMPPYKLFDTLAVPLYPAPEHREISLRHVLRGMGGRSQSARGMRRAVSITAAVLVCARCCRRRKDGSKVEPAAPTEDSQKHGGASAGAGAPQTPPEPSPPEPVPPTDATPPGGLSVEQEGAQPDVGDVSQRHELAQKKALQSKMDTFGCIRKAASEPAAPHAPPEPSKPGAGPSPSSDGFDPADVLHPATATHRAPPAPPSTQLRQQAVALRACLRMAQSGTGSGTVGGGVDRDGGARGVGTRGGGAGGEPGQEAPLAESSRADAALERVARIRAAQERRLLTRDQTRRRMSLDTA